MRSADLRRSRLRVRLAQLALLLGFGVLAARAAHLSLLDPRAVRRGEAQVLSVLALAPQRGLIVDRGGAELALSVDAPSVYAVPREVRDPAATAAALSRALGMKTKPLLRRLRSAGSFVYLARWVEPERARQVADLSLPGIGVLHEPRRTYPYRELAGAVLGFANIDGEGVRGVERLDHEWLSGTRRRVPVERDARGRLLLGPGLDPREGVGGDVALTLDLAFQADAEGALQEALALTGARGGFVVSLEPRSGDLLALAEQPGFDPNRFRSLPFASTRSRIFLDALEPGSVLKPFVVAAALEAGMAQPLEEIDLEGGLLRMPGKEIRDLHPRERLTVAGILRVSSNVGAVKLAQRVGARRHFDCLRGFGFGSRTGSGFPEESSGLLRPWKRWKPVDHATIAFGQGINVTPIQLAAATAALANDGVWVRPRLVAARRRPGASWQATRPDAGRRAVSSATARHLLEMLQEVTGPEGTGRLAALSGVAVAGKTGTAQKLDAESGTYSANRYLAWFAGVAPTHKARIVVVVGLDEPQGAAHTGGAVAAPLFARVAAAHLTRLGVPTRPAQPAPRVRVAEASAAGSPSRKPAPGRPKPAARPAPTAAPAPPAAPPAVTRAGDRVLIPDFRGLSVDEVKQITAGTSLHVEIRGSGRAVAQEPDPGTILAGRGRRVRVRFAPGGREG